MKRAAIMAAGLLSVAFLWTVASRAQTAPASARPTWEYSLIARESFPTLKKQMWVGKFEDAIIPDSADIAGMLEMAGADGWELVCVVQTRTTEPLETTYYFKRPGKP